MFEKRVPVGELQYSTQLRASSGVPVPRFTESMGVAAELAAEPHELVGAETGWSRCSARPAREPSAATRAWTDTVHPVIAGGEVPAGIADDGHGEAVERSQHVATKAVFRRRATEPGSNTPW